ncbi:MAG: flagellar biosynthetic protein FliR [Pseudomonadales bacterium]|nr:flagellar biosynthetic protein FliR [Pseudomonadales bacterium]
MLLLNEAQISQWLGEFLWPLMRVSGFVLTAPIFGSSLVPPPIRILFAISFTLFIMPVLPQVQHQDIFSIHSILLIASELLIGLSMGFVVQMIFEAVIFAGQHLAMLMGLGFATMINPQSGGSMPVISQFFVIIATLLFLSFNGHLMFLSAVLDSFHYLPIGQWYFDSNTWWALASLGSSLFSNGLLIALPAMIALLIVQFGFGVMSRAAPTMNLFAVGFPVSILFGFVIIYLMLPNLSYNLTVITQQMFILMNNLFRP